MWPSNSLQLGRARPVLRKACWGMHACPTAPCCCCAGHGGGAVSQFCSQQLPAIVRRNIHQVSLGGPVEGSCLGRLLQHSFEECDKAIPEAAAAEGGSTAVCCLVGPSRIWVASCGERAGGAMQLPVLCMSPAQHATTRPACQLLASGAPWIRDQVQNGVDGVLAQVFQSIVPRELLLTSHPRALTFPQLHLCIRPRAGDSRAVVARKGGQAIALTDDHKPERPDEAVSVVVGADEAQARV